MNENDNRTLYNNWNIGIVLNISCTFYFVLNILAILA